MTTRKKPRKKNGTRSQDDSHERAARCAARWVLDVRTRIGALAAELEEVTAFLRSTEGATLAEALPVEDVTEIANALSEAETFARDARVRHPGPTPGLIREWREGGR